MYILSIIEILKKNFLHKYFIRLNIMVFTSDGFFVRYSSLSQLLLIYKKLFMTHSK